MSRLVYLLGLAVLSSGAFAGLSSKGAADDRLRASESTYYYVFYSTDAVFEGHCIPGELITLENCINDPERRKNISFALIEKPLKDLLDNKIQYEKNSKEIDTIITYCEKQIGLLKVGHLTPAKEKKIKELQARLKTANIAKAHLVPSEVVMEEMVRAMKSPPELVTVAGDGMYPHAEKHIDVLHTAFSLVAPDSIEAAWCTKEPYRRKLFLFVSKAMSKETIESKCEELGGRLPTMADLKGRNTAPSTAIDEHHRYHAKGCQAFSASAVGRSLPTISYDLGSARAMWLADMQSTFDSINVYALIGPQGHQCHYDDRFSEATKLGGVCVIEEKRNEEMPRDLFNSLPCGTTKAASKK